MDSPYCLFNKQTNDKISRSWHSNWMWTNMMSRECKVLWSPSLQVEHLSEAKGLPTLEADRTSKGRLPWPSKRGSLGPVWQGPWGPSCQPKWQTHTRTLSKIYYSHCTALYGEGGPLSTRHRWRNPFIVNELYLPRTSSKRGTIDKLVTKDQMIDPDDQWIR